MIDKMTDQEFIAHLARLGEQVGEAAGEMSRRGREDRRALATSSVLYFFAGFLICPSNAEDLLPTITAFSTNQVARARGLEGKPN